jgi:hypothetical protein
MISADKVSAIVTILTEECGARFDASDSYAFGFYIGKSEHIEWRFMGALGFGGKFRHDGYHNDGIPYVDCYQEDGTAERRAMMERANQRLKALFALSEDEQEPDAKGATI